MNRCNTKLVLAMLALAALPDAVLALPQGGEVTHGDAQIEISSAQRMRIQQNSQRAIINYDSFSVAENESVSIIQPNSDAALLNRVIGNNASEIFGNIDANGHVFLINQSGIVFSQSSQVNVGSLTASTLNIGDEQFMQGRQEFASHDAEHAGIIENRGSIRSGSEGRIVFIAPAIVNEGRIHSESGDVILASGNAVFVQDEDSPIALLIDEGAQRSLIENHGRIEAQNINLYALSSDQLYSSLISHSGALTAVGNTSDTSKVDIHSNGEVFVSGTISATNTNASTTTPANININAARIGIDASLTVDAALNQSGNGGDITLTASDKLVLGANSTLSANAGAQGDGGNIIAYSPETLLVRRGAELYARAGSQSGDGGFIETSGIEHIEFFGHADASATNGNAGLVYIDPIDISIQSGGGDNSYDSSFNWQPGSTTGTAIIDPASIHSSLSSGTNVTIDTASGTGGPGNITFNSSFDFNGIAANATLSLIADNTISFAANVGIRDSDTTSPENLSLVLNAASDIIMNSSSFIDVADGSVHLTAGNNAQLTGISSTRNATDAIRLSIAGQVSDAGDEQTDFQAVNGGLTADIGTLNDLEVELATLSLNATGDVVLHQLGSAGLDIQTANVSGNLELDSSGQITLSHSGHALLGDVRLTATNSAIVLPNTGLTTFGSAWLSGSEVRDTADHTVSFVADALHITQTNASNNSVFNGAIDAIAINHSGTGNITINNTRALTLLDLINANNTSITASELILSDSGVNGGNLLTLSADDIRAQSGREISINANRLVLGSNLSGGDLSIATQIDSLSVNNAGANTLTVVEGDSLTLSSAVLAAGGSLSITSGTDLSVANSGIGLQGAVNSNLQLLAGSDLHINANIQDSVGSVDNTTHIVLNAANHITIAENIAVNAGSGTIRANALAGNISLGSLSSASNASNAIQLSAGDRILGSDQAASTHLRAQQGGVTLTAVNGIENVNSDIAALTLNNLNGQIDVANSGDLILSAANLGDANLELSAQRLTLPNVGLSSDGSIALHARDIFDTDRILTINAADLLLNLSEPLGNLTLNTQVDRLQASLSGATLRVNQSGSLAVGGIDGGNANAIAIADGNFFLSVSDGDLNVNGNILVSDAPVADQTRNGLISLRVDNGNLLIGTTQSVVISSQNTADQNLGDGLVNGDQTAIALELTNATTTPYRIQVGNDDANISSSISARGGNIDIRARNTSSDSTSANNILNLGLDSQFYVDNSNTDSVTGLVLLNGQRSVSREPFIARRNRQITLSGTADSSLSGLLNQQNGAIVIEDINNEIKAGLDEAATNPENAGTDTVGRAFKVVFGDCETNKDAGKCEVDSALQSFLSKWTVGGELPPKVEVNDL